MAERLLAAALLALAATAAGAAQDLATLFHTPEERARLDRLRRGDAPPERTVAPRSGSEVTGFVQRSDGRSTVWIDGVPLQVANPRAAPLLDPKAVRGQASGGEVKLERREPK